MVPLCVFLLRFARGCQASGPTRTSLSDAERSRSDGVAERAAEAIEVHFDPVAVFQLDAVAEAEGVCAEEVHVHVAGLAVAFELEVMVLEVGEAVAHVLFAGLDGLLPEGLAVALDADLAGDRLKVRADDQLRTEAAGAQLRAREVEVVALLELVIGEFVADRHADAMRRAVVADEIDAGDLGFFAAVFGIGRDVERCEWGRAGRSRCPCRTTRARCRFRPQRGGRLRRPTETSSCCR